MTMQQAQLLQADPSASRQLLAQETPHRPQRLLPWTPSAPPTLPRVLHQSLRRTLRDNCAISTAEPPHDQIV